MWARELEEEELDAEEDTPRNAMDFYSKIQSLCETLRGGELVAVTVDNDLADVVEIFKRLNNSGTSVAEADIYLGVVAARPGNKEWVSKKFLPFLQDELAPAGFDIGPNLLFRSLTAVGTNKVRLKSIGSDFWEQKALSPAWAKTQAAWRVLIKHLEQKGILSLDLLPSANALIPLVALLTKYPQASFDPLFLWFLQASFYGRYGSAGDTKLEEDLRAVESTRSPEKALGLLMQPLRKDITPFTAEEYQGDYADSRSLRLMLYLLIYKQKARDWDDHGWRIGFDNTKLLQNFRPQWHHIFPRKYLEALVENWLMPRPISPLSARRSTSVSRPRRPWITSRATTSRPQS